MNSTSFPKVPSIEVRGLSKKFQRNSTRSGSLKTFLVRLGKGQLKSSEKQEFSVLSDLSFTIHEGEFVGIMGRNGVGKSTLLKLISGIYEPTHGTIKVKGTIAPLIELGAGFNPDLSGYENIFLNASILGFGREVTKKAVPEILSFSGLGDHIYSPVRNYSSGMQVRLGFAIATHLDAPILLIDEVLAVGDLEFQNKCINKIKELHKQRRTIVLITHNPDAVRNHCDRCVLIDKHKIVFDGPAAQGAGLYEQNMDLKN